MAQPLVVLHLALEQLLRPLVQLLALDDLDRDRMAGALRGGEAHLGEGALAQHFLLQAVVRQLAHQRLVALQSLRGGAAYGVSLYAVGGGLLRWIRSLAVLLHLLDLLLHRDDRNLAMGRALVPHRDGLGTSPPGSTPKAVARLRAFCCAALCRAVPRCYWPAALTLRKVIGGRHKH